MKFTCEDFIILIAKEHYTNHYTNTEGGMNFA